MITSRILCTVTLICAGAALTPAVARAVEGQVLVAFASSVKDPSAIAVSAGAAGLVGELPAIGVWILRAADPRATAARLARRSDVRYAEVDSTVQAATIPNDPKFPDQWGLRNGGLATADIEADTGWVAAGLGGFPAAGGVAVGVVDTGVDVDHPDLAGAIASCVTSNTKAATRSKIKNRVCADDSGHGSHVSGTIAARTNNAMGVAGVAFSSALHVCKALSGPSRTGTIADVAACIVHTRDQGAKVISLSLTAPDSATLHNAIQYAWENGTGALVVASAGNTGDTSLVYPAAYPEVLSVAATDRTDQHASFSTANAAVDVAAPGVDILSTGLAGDYLWSSGTSMAAAFATGAAAMLATSAPNLTAEQLAARLVACSDDLGPRGRDPQFGAGRIDVARAVKGTGCLAR